MDPFAPLYWLLMLTIFIALMRMRKIAISPTKRAPRIHRKTYIKN